MPSQAVKIGDDGKLLIPNDFRRELGLDAGDTVTVELTEDGLRVRSLSAAIRTAQASCAASHRPNEACPTN